MRKVISKEHVGIEDPSLLEETPLVEKRLEGRHLEKESDLLAKARCKVLRKMVETRGEGPNSAHMVHP